MLNLGSFFEPCLINLLADFGGHLGVIFWYNLGSFSNKKWMIFRRPLDCFLEAFPGLLGSIVEGLNAILAPTTALIRFQKRGYAF